MAGVQWLGDAAIGRGQFELFDKMTRLNAVVIDADEQTGRATDIERLSYGLEELKDLGIGSVRSTV